MSEQELLNEIKKLNEQIAAQSKKPDIPHVDASKTNTIEIDPRLIAEGKVLVDLPQRENIFAGKRFGSIEEIAKNGLRDEKSS